MRTKLITKSKFIINPKSKVVICVMNVDPQLCGSELWHTIESETWKLKAPMVDNIFGKFTVKAVAKCNPNDTFDEAIGRKIAESKAKVKAFRIAKNIWSCIAKRLLNEHTIAMEMYSNCRAMEKFEFNHVEELSK